MQKRLWWFYGALFTAICGLLFRIFTLSDQYLIKVAGKQATVSVTVAHTRGTIYDRNRVPLVNGTTEYRAGVTSNAEAVAALSGVMDTDAFAAMSKTLQNGRPAVVRLQKLVAAREGISLFQVPVRYGQRVLAPHVIGYMDADQSSGLTGIEAACDAALAACSGTAGVSYTVDANGKPLEGVQPVMQNTTAESKGGIVLTLDTAIQEMTENIAAKYIKKGAVIVMQPQTGNILAMASLPTFQPQKVADVLQDKDAPLLNRALCTYNCGSVFKIISAAAALETGTTADKCCYCGGSITIGNTIFHCHNRLGHGALTMSDAFSKSCNCYFIQLMREVGGNPLWRLASRMQFDSALTLCDGYRTEAATLPQPESLQSPAVLANFSFGQGELTATPVHIAQMISTVVNDGTMVPPRILAGYIDKEGKVQETAGTAAQQVFSASTAATLRKMMEAVVAEGGTGAAGMPAAGGAGAKTGTAETGWSRTDDETHAVVQSWFAGYYPANEPRYVIVVLAENADNTGAKTAPVFKEIADQLYQMETGE